MIKSPHRFFNRQSAIGYELVRRNLNSDFAPPRPVEIAQENALPPSQDEASAFNEQRFGISDESSFQVGITISVVVVVVTVARSQPIEKLVPILLQARVIIFVNQDSRCGMRDKHEACALKHTGFRNQFLERLRDVLEVNPRPRLNL